MKNIRGYSPLIAVFVIAIVGLVFFMIKANASSGIQDTPENQEIMKTMDKGYDAIGYASHTNDPSKLSDVFVDTSDYKLPDDVKQDVTKVFGPDVAAKAGYLTAMQTKYIVLGKAEVKMKAARDKAKAENREMTNEEFQAVIKDSGGIIPPSGRYSSASGKTQLTYKSIEINGDHATVYYDDGAAYQKATLVKINGKWFIAGIESIVVHF